MARAATTRWTLPRRIGIGVASLITAFSLRAGATEAPKHVLLLHSFGRDVAPYSRVAAAFRTTIAKEFGEPVNLYEAPLDVAHLADSDMAPPVVDFLERRFSGRPLDVVVAFGGPASRFTAQYGDRLFRSVPIVFAGADPRVLPPDAVTPNTVLVTQAIDPTRQLNDILQLLPATTHVMVVLGSAPVERFWMSELRRDFEPFAGRLHFTWTDSAPLEDILAQCAVLPARSVILFGLFIVDGAGVPYDNDDALKRLHAAANAPIFGFFEGQVGLGAVGGRLYQDAKVGELGARAAIRLLRGESPSQIPSQVFEAAPPVYDDRELQRWGIEADRLPAGSTVRFREPGLWEQYRGRIVGVALFSLAQTAMIVGLLANRAARKRAEANLRRSEERLNTALDAASVGAWGMDVRSMQVWASARERELFGFPADEPLNLERFMNAIHPEDREFVREAVGNAMRTRAPLVAEFRVVRPDGTERWITARGHPQFDAKGEPTQLMGVSVDITDRKRADTALRELGRRLIQAQEDERGRLAKDLHDGLSQNLALLAVELDMFGQSPKLTAAEVRTHMNAFSQQVRLLSADVHRLAGALHPAKLEQLGLVSALGSFCREVQAGVSLTVEFSANHVPRHLPTGMSICLYRVAQEALQNAVKHSGAGRVTVKLEAEDGHIALTVADNGRGFNPAAEAGKGTLGLVSMDERVRLAHGEMRLESAPGRGTLVTVRLPVQAEDDA